MGIPIFKEGERVVVVQTGERGVIRVAKSRFFGGAEYQVKLDRSAEESPYDEKDLRPA